MSSALVTEELWQYTRNELPLPTEMGLEVPLAVTVVPARIDTVDDDADPMEILAMLEPPAEIVEPDATMVTDDALDNEMALPLFVATVELDNEIVDDVSPAENEMPLVTAVLRMSSVSPERAELE